VHDSNHRQWVPMALPISRLTRLRRILEEAKAFRHGKANGEQHDQTRRHLLMRTHPRLCLTYCVWTHQGHLWSPPFAATWKGSPARWRAVSLGKMSRPRSRWRNSAAMAAPDG